jgi:hypothetical protein
LCTGFRGGCLTGYYRDKVVSVFVRFSLLHYTILLSKLYRYGIRGKPLILASYLVEVSHIGERTGLIVELFPLRQGEIWVAQ